MKHALSNIAQHLHHGYLHRALGVPEGQKIPASKVSAAAHSSNSHLAHAARLAETFAHHRPGNVTAHHEPQNEFAHPKSCC